MNLTNALIPHSWLLISLLLFVAVLARALFAAPWGVLKKPGIFNLVLGASVAVLAFWQIKASIQPGLNLHLLGATALTLLFGPWFAILALTLTLLLSTAWGGTWQAFAVNGLLMVVLPVTVSWWIYRLVDSKLPNHFFIYVFLNAFLGAGVTIAVMGFAASWMLGLMGAYPLDYLLGNYLPYYLLMAWSEAMTTGMIMTVLVAYKPHWVATFDDNSYIKNR
ncbi:MAG TPA: energy-coupling factor ABC transporter permease [Sulfuriferula sp.]|nr:energy-coupling factor ABC transporter permease [Sulfuriferula sp.]